MATKRVGWGALLNSVKDKKQKKDVETSQQDAPPAKKLKSETKTDILSKKEENKVAEKEEKVDKKGEKKIEAKEEKKPKKEDKADKEGDKKIEAKKVEKTPKKEEKPDKTEKKIEAKEEKKESKGDKKTEVKPEKKTEEKAEVKPQKKTQAKEEKKEAKETEVKAEKKEAKGEKKRKDREADNSKPTTNGKVANTTTTSKSEETKNKTKNTELKTQKTEQEEKEEKHQLAKDAVRLALKDRPFFDYTKEEPIVVYLRTEDKEGEHTFYLDLLAKSYLSNFSDSVSFKKTKLVLGFDVEFYHGKALTIQLSTASFSIVFNLHSRKTKKTELSPGLRHIFSSTDYIKCGVGVPADMITLQGQFQISISGMFDISWFVLDMGLTPGLWSLDTLGHDIFGIGKVHGFLAKSYELNRDQIQYASRDGWLGYLLTEYFFDFFKQSTSMYSWAKAYVNKKDDALVRAIGEEKPFRGEQEDKDEKEDENEKDKTEEVPQESVAAAAPQKGIRGRSTASIQSKPNVESRHIIRNKLEAIKETRRKAYREEENFNNLIQQLSKIKEEKVAKRQKTEEAGEEAKQEEEEEEDVQVQGVIYNWV